MFIDLCDIFEYNKIAIVYKDKDFDQNNTRE